MTRQDTNDLERLGRVSSTLATLYASITEEQWKLPTPCTEWTLDELVDHVTGGNRFTIRIIAGEAAEDALTATMRSFGSDHDTRAAALESIERQRDAFAEAGVLDRRCQHLGAELSGHEVLRMRLHDLIIHAWDIAEAIDPPAVIDDELVAWALADLADPDSQVVERFGLESSPPAEPGATDQARLLAAFGR